MHKKKKAAPAWAEPEGRLGRIGELRLLEVDDWMYRPEVQDPAPVTEDQLAELSEVMMQLGTDQAGAEIRAKMQSANLMSDMESFKVSPGELQLPVFIAVLSRRPILAVCWQTS